MSAMHAMALPEDDPDRQAAAICRFHSRTARNRTARTQAPAGEPAPAPAREPAPAPARESASAPVSKPSSALAAAPTPADRRVPTPADRRALGSVGSRARSAAHGRAAVGQGTSSRPAYALAPRDQTPVAAPLRLTRRGRAVIAAAAVLLVMTVSLLAASAAQATSHAAPSRAAGQNLSRVVVLPGQTLWSIAEGADPHGDIRMVIQQVVELNGLTSDAVLAGQRLWVPRG